MGLKDQTTIGLTFGQIISIITILITLGGGILFTYSTINVQIASLQVRTLELERSRTEEQNRAEIKRVEDKNSFESISKKVDLILFQNNIKVEM